MRKQMPQFKHGIVEVTKRFESSPILQRVVNYFGLLQEGKKFQAAMVISYMRLEMGLPQSFQRRQMGEFSATAL